MPNPSGTSHHQLVVERRGTLQAHPLLGTLSAAHIDRLVRCIIAKSFARGGKIFAKGDPGSCLFAVVEGMVQISAPSAGGHEVVLNEIVKGQIFGEIALLDGRPRTADAIAITDCQLFVIERRDFLPLMREDPEIALRLIETLCLRLRRTTEQAESVMFLPLPCRLAKVLLQLADGGEDGRERKVFCSQKTLGERIGVTREGINKQLAIWKQRKWVRLSRGEIVILLAKALERLAEGDEG